MGIFDRGGPKQATQKDAVLIRDGLVQVIQVLKRRAEDPDASGVEALVQRLGRFPAPTGLKRELTRLLPTLMETTDLGEPFGEAAQAMGETMKVLAFPEPKLEEPVERFADQIPNRVDLPQAKRLRRDAIRLAKQAKPMRARMLAARKQTRELLVQLAARLGDSGGAAARVDRVLSELEGALSSNDAEALAKLQPKLLEQVSTAREDTRSLRSNLEQALDEVHTLQRTVDAQAEALRNAKQKLSQDPLTQIANRRALDQELPRLVAEAQATGAPLSVLALDIDHFKAVNDTYGHAAGDVVLKAVAQKAAGLLRSEDLIARAGGEEFVVLLPGTPMHMALQIAERIRSGIEALPFSQGAMRFTVTMSIGVAQLTAKEQGADALARADAALYQAKHGGRNQSIAA